VVSEARYKTDYPPHAVCVENVTENKRTMSIQLENSIAGDYFRQEGVERGIIFIWTM
jgi:hypothetical protein